jgi:hypothetical protein
MANYAALFASEKLASWFEQIFFEEGRHGLH